MYKIDRYKLALLATGAALVVSAAPTFAVAAEAAAAADEAPSQIEAVVVTARKTSENLLTVPVAVTAITAKDIEIRGIETMVDIANFTPGVNVDQAGSGSARSDRSFQTIIIRGMNPSATTSPTASVFIDGVPVDPDFIQNVDDVARVEVLKGPQSAFFGRSTFAGAVNVVTKDPSNTFGGNVSAEVGTYDTRAFKGMIEGPIVPDVLTARVGAYYTGHDGSYSNPLVSGQTLGAQTTRGVDAAATFRPTSKLTIKASAEMFEDRDGPGATGLILPTNQSNCKLSSGLAFYCGTLPSLNSGQSPAANTQMTPAIIAGLAKQGGIINPDDAVKGFGLRRDAYHGALNVSYDLPYGFNITSLTGASYEDWSELSDLSNLNGPYLGSHGFPAYSTYAGFPFIVEQVNHQFSEEARLSSDQTKPLRGLLGVSYVQSRAQSALGTNGAAGASGPGGAKTSGVFFSLNYDVLKQVTVSFDGRYQVDDLSTYTVGGPTLYEAKFYNFLPRVSIQYKFAPDMMTYFTYSEGVNPGAFNSTLQVAVAPAKGLTAAGLAYVESALDASVVVRPEHLTNYELGLKGRFWDGKATLSADVYYDKWTDQIDPNSALITNPAYDTNVNVPAVGTVVPDLVGPFSTNAGKSTYEGFEVDGNLLPVEHVSLNVSGAITNTRYDEFVCLTCYSKTQEAGDQAPYVSKYSSNVGAQYSNTLPYGGGVDWYVRGDFVYKSGVYLQSDNIEKTPDVETFNIRAGISKGKISIDGYINNVTNSRAYLYGTEGFNFFNFSPAFLLGLPQLRTFGIKAKYTF